MLRKSLIWLSVIGLLDALYLTYVKLVSGGVCVAGSQCEIVNASRYSTIAGVPIAVFGAGAYAVMLAVLLLEKRQPFFAEHAELIVLGVSFFGVLYSLYLTYLELFVIHAICPFCALSAIVLLIILILAFIRFRQSMSLS